MQNKQLSHVLKACLGATVCAGVLAMMPMASAAEIVNPSILTTAGLNKVGQTVTYSVTFDPSTLANGDAVEFTFPAEFDVSGATVTSASDTGGNITSVVGGVSGSTVTATLSTSGTVTDDTTIVIAGIETPSVAGFYDLGIETPADEGTGRMNISLNATVVANPATISSNADYEFSISGMPYLTGGDLVQLVFPDGTAVSNSNFVITGASGTASASSGAGTINVIVDPISGSRMNLLLDTGATVGTGATLTVSLSDIVNPDGAGVHGIGIDIFREDESPVAQGIANAAIGNAVQITAVVTDALLMTLTNDTISLSVDPANRKNPAWETGQDLGHSTTINVSSNSPTGYAIQARMDDGTGEARLIDGSGHEIISSSHAAAVNNKNYFGYYAVNDEVPTVANAAQGFQNNDTTLLEGSTSDVIGSNTMTDASLPFAIGGGRHTVNYDLNVSFLTPAGMYTSTIFYTAVASF